MIFRIAKLIGWRTIYYVSYFRLKAGGGALFAGQSIDVSPWLTVNDISRLDDMLSRPDGDEITIISITKL